MDINIGALPQGTRYYESNLMRCGRRCVVHGVLCTCEFVAGHDGACEKVPTRFLASAEDYRTLNVFRDFLPARKALKQ